MCASVFSVHRPNGLNYELHAGPTPDILFCHIESINFGADLQAERKVNYEFTAAFLAHFVGDLPPQKEVEAAIYSRSTISLYTRMHAWILIAFKILD